MSESDIKFTAVSPRFVNSCWGKAKPLLEKACEESNGRFKINSIKDQIDSGVQVLWMLYDSDSDEILVSITTSVLNYPDRRLLAIMFCGADGLDSYWLDHRDKIVPELVEWAKIQGCSGIEVSGREGWVKVLAPYGFEKTYVTLEVGF